MAEVKQRTVEKNGMQQRQSPISGEYDRITRRFSAVHVWANRRIAKVRYGSHGAGPRAQQGEP